MSNLEMLSDALGRRGKRVTLLQVPQKVSITMLECVRMVQREIDVASDELTLLEQLECAFERTTVRLEVRDGFIVLRGAGWTCTVDMSP